MIRSFYNSCLVQKIAESHIYGEIEKRNACSCACLTEIGVFTTQDIYRRNNLRYERYKIEVLEDWEKKTQKRDRKEQ